MKNIENSIISSYGLTETIAKRIVKREKTTHDIIGILNDGLETNDIEAKYGFYTEALMGYPEYMRKLIEKYKNTDEVDMKNIIEIVKKKKDNPYIQITEIESYFKYGNRTEIENFIKQYLENSFIEYVKKSVSQKIGYHYEYQVGFYISPEGKICMEIKYMEESDLAVMEGEDKATHMKIWFELWLFTIREKVDFIRKLYTEDKDIFTGLKVIY